MKRHFFLFLRSFRFENLENNWYYNPSLLNTSEVYEMTKIDEELETIFRNVNAELICLGDVSRIKLGSARISSKDFDWKDKVKLLMKHSTGIIVCPGPTKGTIEEIVFLYNNPILLKKTVFIMLPSNTGILFSVVWFEVRKMLSEYGITFPTFNKTGLLFNSKGENIELVCWENRSPINLGSNILKLMDS
jgi:hypothetical protein